MLLNTTPEQKWFTTVNFILEGRGGLGRGGGGGGEKGLRAEKWQ